MLNKKEALKTILSEPISFCPTIKSNCKFYSPKYLFWDGCLIRQHSVCDITTGKPYKDFSYGGQCKCNV